MTMAEVGRSPALDQFGLRALLPRLAAPSLLVGLFVPMGLILVLAIAGPGRLTPDVLLLSLAFAPMLSAIFTSILVTGGIATFASLVGLQLTMFGAMPGINGPEDALPALVALMAIGALAACAALIRDRVRPQAAAAGAGKAGHGPPVTPAVSRDVDELTGLPTGAAALASLRNSDLAGALVVVLDVDSLRTVNAEHGSAIGDECLQAVGGRMRYRLGVDDVVCRWQGDQFLLVLQDPSADEACESLLQRVRGCVSGQPIRTAAGLVPLTATLGWSTVSATVGASVDETAGIDVAVGEALADLHRARAAKAG